MKPRSLLRTTYIAGFLFSLHVVLTVYVNSSFLEMKIPDNLIGLLYAASAIVSVVGLHFIPRLINKFGSKVILGILMVCNIGSLIGMIISPNVWTIASCFVAYFAFSTMVYLGFDIIIEQWSAGAAQGTVRGKYLAALSLGFMIAPFISGFITDRLGFGVLYGLAITIIIPVLALIVLRLPTVRITHPSKDNILYLVGRFVSHKKLRSVFLINFILQFFYAWMIIYSPIYLHESAGIPWDRLGIVFMIMLVPFVLLEYPVGKLTDIWGEKKFLFFGLLIMGTATMFVAQAPTMSIIAIAATLFATRVGASIVEVATESYFFKHVHPDDTGTIGFFRNTYPFAYLIAPVIASIIIGFAPIWTLFIILGIICLGGMFLTKNIK